MNSRNGGQEGPWQELLEGLVEQKGPGSPAPGAEAGKAPNQVKGDPGPFMPEGNSQPG